MIIRGKTVFVKEPRLMFFDTHAHLTCDALYHDLPAILHRAKEHKVDHIVNICTDAGTLERGLTLAKEQRWIFNAGATSPHDVEKEGEKNFVLFEEAAKKGKLVAIGETGLDYYYEHSKRDVQQAFLRRYLALARQTSLPVIIHCRDAFNDLFEMIDDKNLVVLHCFTGMLEEAREAVNRGWLISFSGIVTFKNSHALREVVKQVPIDHLLLETDAPYLAPQGRRGKRNEPGYIEETARLIAELKGMSLDELASCTSANAFRIFSLRNCAKIN
jgi:TatD DNase family protein